MGASPARPRDDMARFDTALCQSDDDATDFLNRPADQICGLVRALFGSAALARVRMAASIAKASMTSETCRCQPCQERVLLWSRPSSFLAVSKLFSMAQRCPSTPTRVSMVVPAGLPKS